MTSSARHLAAPLLCAAWMCLFSSTPALAAKDLDPEFLEISDCPEHPGCHAVILLEEIEFSNESNRTKYSERRLMKLFTDEGIEKWSDVTLRAAVGSYDVRNLSGRTILPDGTEIPLDQQNVRVKLLRQGKRRVKFKSATFPGVVPGAIIEYSFDILTKGNSFFTEDTWSIQHELPVLISRYVLKKGKFDLGWRQTGMENVRVEHEAPYKNVEVFTARNVPPLPDEPMGPPQEALRARMSFFLPELQKIWLGVTAGKVSGAAAEFMEGPGIAEKARELVSDSDSALTKVRKIYEFVQESIGAEEQRASETEESAIKDAGNAGEVLARGFGNEYERTLLFLSLVKQAGLEGGLLLIASRYGSPFDENKPEGDQFDSFAAAVRTGDGWTFYDPAEKHCPFGMISPEKEGGVSNAVLLVPQKGQGVEKTSRVQNLILTTFDPAPYSIAAIPFSGASKNVLTRTMRVALQENGSATVSVSEQGRGLADLDLRKRLDGTDEQRRADLGDSLADLFKRPRLSSLSIENEASFDKDVTVKYEFETPEFASVVGDRILLTPSFESAKPNPFTVAARRTPVHFPHAQRTVDTVFIDIPEGYAVDEMPKATTVRDEPYVFVMSYTKIGQRLKLSRRLEIDTGVSPVEDYPRLKTLYETIQQADRQVVVLRKEAAE